ncbi:MAG: type III-A CRISPR-associated RAMP protein Csm5 [bacterium]|nr:type III-A CRISPR-associated RAMP protein Csm5 [bacterium]
MKIKIRTVTPTLVRSGEEISNVTECVVDPKDKKLRIIDKDKLMKVSKVKAQNPKELVDELSSLIVSENKTIEDFLRRKEIGIEQVTKYSIEIRSDIDEKRRRNIYLPMLSGEKAYIPGSTLKGIIRSALLFYYLENNKDKQKDLLDKRDLYVGEDILRIEARRIDTDAMKYVTVRDTEGIPFSELALYKIERLPQRIQSSNKTQGLYQYIIAIPNNKEFYTEVVIEVFEKDNIPDYWKSFFNNRDREDNIWKALRNYSIKLVDKEIEILRRLKTVRKEGIEAIDSLITYYKEMQTVLRKPENKSVYVPIGFGKTYYFNSLGYFIPEASFKTLKIIKTNIDPSLYPSTRWVLKIGKKYCPIGWCEIKRE